MPRAELYALRAVLPLVLPPAIIYMHQENHVKPIKKGKAWCTQALRPHADLWEAIWFNLEYIGVLRSQIAIVYTPGHAKEKPTETA